MNVLLDKDFKLGAVASCYPEDHMGDFVGFVEHGPVGSFISGDFIKDNHSDLKEDE